MQERRKFIRLDASIKITYRVLKKSQLPNAALSQDISGGGIRFPVDEKLRKGTALELEIEIPDGQGPIKAMGEVAWTKESTFRWCKAINCFETGVKFTKIDPLAKDRIFKFIYQRIHRSLYDDLSEAQND